MGAEPRDPARPGDLPPPSPPPTGNGQSGPGGRYDRVPPASLEAEVSVLGAAVLSRAAAAEVMELVRTEDFYRSAHRTVFEGIYDLFARGEPIDAITLLDWLTKRGKLEEVGGASAIHDLVAAVPTAANAAHYARIVREKAILRALIDAGTKVVQMGYDAGDDVNLTVDRAEALIYEIGQSGHTSEYAQLKDLLNESFERIEQLAENRSEVTGLATGFNDLDRLTAGLQPQNLVIIAARPSMGKCIAESSGVITDSKTGARRSVREVVEDLDGFHVEAHGPDRRLHHVPVATGVYNGVQAVFDVRTRLGRRIRVTANHPFLTYHGWRELGDLNPGDLIAVPRVVHARGQEPGPDAEAKLLGYLLGDGGITHRVPIVTTTSAAIEADIRSCAANFGVRVKAGSRADNGVRTLALRPAHARVTRAHISDRVGVTATTVSHALNGSGNVSADRRREIEQVAAELGYSGDSPRNFLRDRLEELGLWGKGSHDKFVPDAVFRYPNEQIATFLSRLYACDGSAWVAKDHGYFGISYATVSERLAHDVQHLLLRFGIIARIRERQVKYGDERRRAFEIEIRDAANCRRFIEEIGIFSKEEQCAAVMAVIEQRRGLRDTNVDLLPIEVWALILAEKADRPWADISQATGRPRNHNWHVGKRRPSRRLVGELAEALHSEPLRNLADSDVYWDEIVSIEPAGEDRVYDLEVPGLHNFVANDVIVHNSSLSLNVTHYVASELGKPAVIFSLEMSKQEIVQRLLAAEASIDSSRLRTGRLQDHDWRKLGDALGKLSTAPLFIDDTPSITLMEIRSKARRLKQRHGLELIVVDYLQLMQSHRRVENRVQEVSEISRGLKMLAKELDVPVMALSQLSRQPENRTDKRPQLADLRESGCLTRETRLFRSDTGQPVTFGELLDGDIRDVPVWSVDADRRLVAANLTHAFPSGTKMAYRVVLASGATVQATANHPFLTLEGWQPLGELRSGSRVATVRALPEPENPTAMDEDEVVLLAHLIGDGTTVARQPVHYTSADEENLDAVAKAAWNLFGMTARSAADGRSARTTQLYLPSPHHLTHGRRNPIAEWLESLGVWDRRARDKQVPRAVFGLPGPQLRLFLRHLWATDGCLSLTTDKRGAARLGLYYGTSSPALAQDVRLLLLRHGIVARIKTVSYDNSAHPGFQVWVTGSEQQRRFLREVGVHGLRGRLVVPALQALDGRRSNTNVDTVPAEVWDRVRTRRVELGMSERCFQAAIGSRYCGSSLYRSAPSRERLGRVAAALGDSELAGFATDDVFWDRIVEVVPIGEVDVFDATVDVNHNFIAEGLILHNSIEQDADIVGFIYRDEVYDENSPDRGVAELIISKHRNGPTGTVRLAFLNHLTKFANLARQPAGYAGPGGNGGGASSPPPPPTPV